MSENSTNTETVVEEVPSTSTANALSTQEPVKGGNKNQDPLLTPLVKRKGFKEFVAGKSDKL